MSTAPRARRALGRAALVHHVRTMLLGRTQSWPEWRRIAFASVFVSFMGALLWGSGSPVTVAINFAMFLNIFLPPQRVEQPTLPLPFGQRVWSDHLLYLGPMTLGALAFGALYWGVSSWLSGSYPLDHEFFLKSVSPGIGIAFGLLARRPRSPSSPARVAAGKPSPSDLWGRIGLFALCLALLLSWAPLGHGAAGFALVVTLVLVLDYGVIPTLLPALLKWTERMGRSRDRQAPARPGIPPERRLMGDVAWNSFTESLVVLGPALAYLAYRVLWVSPGEDEHSMRLLWPTFVVFCASAWMIRSLPIAPASAQGTVLDLSSPISLTQVLPMGIRAHRQGRLLALGVRWGLVAGTLLLGAGLFNAALSEELELLRLTAVSTSDQAYAQALEDLMETRAGFRIAPLRVLLIWAGMGGGVALFLGAPFGVRPASVRGLGGPTISIILLNLTGLFLGSVVFAPGDWALALAGAMCIGACGLGAAFYLWERRALRRAMPTA